MEETLQRTKRTGTMKTAREWFETFPEPYRSQALANCEDENEFYKKASNALYSNFDWEESPQDFDYWDDFYRKLTLQNL